MIRKIMPESYLPTNFMPDPKFPKTNPPRWDPPEGLWVWYHSHLYIVLDVVEYAGNRRVLQMTRAGQPRFGHFAWIKKIKDVDFHKLAINNP